MNYFWCLQLFTIILTLQVSEICSSEQTSQNWELCERLVSTIETEVKQGKLVQEILSLIKEQILADFQIEGLEQPIRKITNFICNTKRITEQKVLEYTQAHIIKCQADSILLPLITAIELSSIECQEVTSVTRVKDNIDAENISELEDGAQSTAIEEGKVLTIEYRQGVMSCKNVSKSKVESDRIPATQTVSEIQEPQVRAF